LSRKGVEKMPPIICIVGKYKAGKTTLVEQLVPELKRRGYRVATIKHNVHGFDLDQPGKDSWRYAQAGSDAVVPSSPQKLALIRKVERDPTLEEITRLLKEDYDLVLAEGFKQSKAPKIEVHRGEDEAELICSPRELLAVVADKPRDISVPQYPLDDIAGLVDLIEERFLTHREEEETTLFINGKLIPLSPFPRDIISKALLGMVSALKGTENLKSLEIWIRRKA